ncbi:type II secretion system F family protein [Candidatus Pacearchaeota archaeon]|nr:type II secretion system F family protein [Candidatus Pacearchaeota archaeon]
MKFNKFHWIGIIIGLVIIIFSMLIRETRFFYFVIGIGVLIGVLPFVINLINQNRIEAEKEEMFIEFARGLVESVKTGTPVSKSIINSKGKSYGVLSEHVNKLANQISMGIPLGSALQVFSKDVNNKTVSRALTLIGQAEKAGGNISEILESVAEAVTMSDKLKQERKAAISTLVVQGYIIFFIFTIIVLVMQFKILPMVEGIADVGVMGETSVNQGSSFDQEEISKSFIYLLLAQGFFSGLAIGKLAEGNVRSGIKHSFALMLTSFLISSGANIFLG